MNQVCDDELMGGLPTLASPERGSIGDGGSGRRTGVSTGDNDPRRKIEAFLKDLTDLTEKHEVWIEGTQGRQMGVFVVKMSRLGDTTSHRVRFDRSSKRYRRLT